MAFEQITTSCLLCNILIFPIKYFFRNRDREGGNAQRDVIQGAIESLGKLLDCCCVNYFPYVKVLCKKSSGIASHLFFPQVNPVLGKLPS